MKSFDRIRNVRFLFKKKRRQNGSVIIVFLIFVMIIENVIKRMWQKESGRRLKTRGLWLEWLKLRDMYTLVDAHITIQYNTIYINIIALDTILMILDDFY